MRQERTEHVIADKRIGVWILSRSIDFHLEQEQLALEAGDQLFALSHRQCRRELERYIPQEAFNG